MQMLLNYKSMCDMALSTVARCSNELHMLESMTGYRDTQWVIVNNDIYMYSIITSESMTNSVNTANNRLQCSTLNMLIWLIVYKNCYKYRIVMMIVHDDVIKWKTFPRYWPFVRRIPVTDELPSKTQWRWALMFSLTCAWTNGWVNNRDVGDLRHYHAYYDVIVMVCPSNGCWAISPTLALSRELHICVLSLFC